MISFFVKLRDFLDRKQLFFLVLPILIFPICCLLELFVIFGLLANDFLQIFLGIYFIFIIPLYPLIVFPGIKEKPEQFYLANKLAILGVGNLSLFVVYAIINRASTNHFQWLDLFLFSSVIFCLNLLLGLI